VTSTALQNIELKSVADGAQRYDLAEQLGEALRVDGAVLVQTERLAELYDELERVSRLFFALPTAEKMKLYIGNSTCHRGYVPPSEKGGYDDEGEVRQYEAFDTGLELPANDTNVIMQTPLMGSNQWPEIPSFRHTVYGCFVELLALSQRLSSLVAHYLLLHDGFFEHLMQKPVSQLRLIHYDGQRVPERKKSNAMGAHTDYEFFSLIDACSPGLQVASHRHGWIAVSPPRGSVVMIAGDMLETITNGYIRSVLHRVVEINVERYSFPFFCGADFDVTIRPVTRNIRGARGPRYAPVRAGEYLLDRLRRDFPYIRKRHLDDLQITEPQAARSLFETRRFEALGREFDA